MGTRIYSKVFPGWRNTCPGPVSPRLCMDSRSPRSSARIVGKKRKITSIPRIAPVGAWTRAKNALSAPGGVDTRSHAAMKTGVIHQNRNTWNSENTIMRIPWKRIRYSSRDSIP